MGQRRRRPSVCLSWAEPGPRARLVPVTAQILDGKAAAAAIKAELTTRLAVLRERGVVPGLGTVLVGDDPGSRWYVNAKHQDCAEVGLESIRVELPATASQADVEKAVDGLNDDPACTTYIVQLPLPRGIDENAIIGRIDPAEGRRRPAPHQPRLARARQGRPAALHPARHRRAAASPRRRDRRPERRGRRSRHHRRTPDGAAADPSQRERHRHPVPHRHPRPRRRGPPRRHRGRRGRSAGHHHRRHGQARRGRAGRRREP